MSTPPRKYLDAARAALTSKERRRPSPQAVVELAEEMMRAACDCGPAFPGNEDVHLTGCPARAAIARARGDK